VWQYRGLSHLPFEKKNVQSAKKAVNDEEGGILIIAVFAQKELKEKRARDKVNRQWFSIDSVKGKGIGGEPKPKEGH